MTLLPLVGVVAVGGLIAAAPWRAPNRPLPRVAQRARHPARYPAAEVRRDARSASHSPVGPLRAVLGGTARSQRKWVACLGAATIVAAFVSPVFALLVLWGGVAQRVWSVRAASRRADAAVIDVLPDLVDLFRVAIRAGCTPSEAVAAVARRTPDPSGRALGAVRAAHQRGASLADALATLPDALGEPSRPLANGLTRALRDGTPLLVPLDRLSTEAKAARRRQGDVRARRLPVMLLFPLVLCTLPAFALLTVVPLLLNSLGSLRL